MRKIIKLNDEVGASVSKSNLVFRLFDYDVLQALHESKHSESYLEIHCLNRSPTQTL